MCSKKLTRNNIPIYSGIILLWVLASASLAKVIEIYPFPTPQQKQAFQHLLQELRCLTCQNQSLAESNAPLAEDMRRIIYVKLQQGESVVAVKNYLVARYSNYILLQPKFNLKNYLLWLSPVFLLGLCLLKLIVVYFPKK